jgi:hypothetical protein
MFKILKYLILFSLIFTSFYSVTTTAQTVNDPNNWGAFGCTKAKVSQGGKYATWSCYGDGNAFLSKVLVENKGLIKTKVNTRIGELKYTAKTPEQKLSFVYNRGVLSYSGYVSGNGFMKVQGLTLDNEGTIILGVDYKNENSYVSIGDACDLKRVQILNYHQNENQIFGRNVSGKSKLALSTKTINSFKTTAPMLRTETHHKEEVSTKKAILKCNDQIENIVKNETLVLEGIYDKDTKTMNANVKIKGYSVPVDLDKIEGEVRDRWLSESSRLENGDFFRFSGKFHFVERYPNYDQDAAIFWHNLKELRLNQIYSFDIIKPDRTDKVNLKGKVFFDYNNHRLANEKNNSGIDFSGFLNNLKIKAISESKQEYIATTDKNGNYEFKDLPLGKYKLSIDADTVKMMYKTNSPLGIAAIEPTYDGIIKVIYLNGSNRNIDMGISFRLFDMVYV